MKNKKYKYNEGFTLIELSIVLVIIGLVVGGVLVGKDLIKSAEVRSVIKDIDLYKTAYDTFILKYNCIAGDCGNATDFFGAADSDPTTCKTTATTGTLTCNGNNNGIVAKFDPLTTSEDYESFRFWQQLGSAGLINGNYTGISGSGSTNDFIMGVNVPAAAIKGAMFGFRYVNLVGVSSTGNYQKNYGQSFRLGSKVPNAGASYPIFTPAEAFAFDQKIDDGKPASGIAYATNPIYPFGNQDACTTSVNDTDFTGNYNFSSVAISCSFYIKIGLY